MTRRSLTSKQREELYDRVRGDKQFPDCNICFTPIRVGQKWHASHNPLLPRALSGEVTGIAHARCNLEHAYTIDIPKIAKHVRIRQRHVGIRKPRTITRWRRFDGTPVYASRER